MRRAAALALLALAASAGQAGAQESAPEPDRWRAELFAGAGAPRGDLGDVADDGLLAGVALGRRLSPRVALRLEGTFQSLERGGRPSLLGGARGPSVHLWHYVAGVEALLTRPAGTEWRLGGFAGLGGTYLDVAPALVPEGVEVSPELARGFTGHEFTLRGALLAGWSPAGGLVLFARGGAFLMLGDAGDPEGSFLGKEAVFTHEAGVRVLF